MKHLLAQTNMAFRETRKHYFPALADWSMAKNHFSSSQALCSESLLLPPVVGVGIVVVVAVVLLVLAVAVVVCCCALVPRNPRSKKTSKLFVGALGAVALTTVWSRLWLSWRPPGRKVH